MNFSRRKLLSTNGKKNTANNSIIVRYEIIKKAISNYEHSLFKHCIHTHVILATKISQDGFTLCDLYISINVVRQLERNMMT